MDKIDKDRQNERQLISECRTLLIKKMEEFIPVDNYERIQQIAHILNTLNRDY